MPAFAFRDLDSDAGQIAGEIRWKPTVDVTPDDTYSVYLAEDPNELSLAAYASEKGRLALQTNIPVGTNFITVPNNFARGAKDHILVYVNPRNGGTEKEVVSKPFYDWSNIQPTTIFTVNFGNQAGSSLSIPLASELGMNFTSTTNGTLTITSLSPQGAIAKWNQLNGTLNVQAGDSVIEVNGASGLQMEQVLLDNAIINSLVIASDVRVTGLTFNDQDPLAGRLGGTISWQEPADTASITYYNIEIGQPGRRLSTNTISWQALVPKGTNSVDVPFGTQRGSALFITASTVNWPHMSRPEAAASVHLHDISGGAPLSPPTGVTFNDLDTREGLIAGTIQWAPPISGTSAYLTDYDIVLAADVTGGAQALQLGTVPRGVNQLIVPAGTSLSSRSYILVYPRNSYGRGPPAVIPLYDTAPSSPTVAVTNVAFSDSDLREGFLGGSITWQPPADVSTVASYTVQLADSAASTQGQTLGTVPTGTNTLVLPAGTPVSQSQRYLLVFTQNPVGLGPFTRLTFVDAALPLVAVRSVSFFDTETRKNNVRGIVSWLPPADTTYVEYYSVYFTNRDATSNETFRKWFLGLRASVGTNQAELQETAIDTGATYFSVYAGNKWGESPTGASTLIVDRFVPQVSVRALAFQDENSTANQVNGPLTWLPPQDVTHVQQYEVFLVTDSGASQRVGALAETGQASYTYFLSAASGFALARVYTANDVGLQATPSSVVLTDWTGSPPTVAPSNLQFVDQDPLPNSISGDLTWTPPAMAQALVTQYVVYLADKPAPASQRLQLTTVNVGTNRVVLTSVPTNGYTYFLVYAANRFGENTALVPDLRINDLSQVPPVTQARNVRNTDTDGRQGYVLGVISWDVPPGATDVVTWQVALGQDLFGGRQVVIGSVPANTTELTLASAVSVADYRYILVYAVGQGNLRQLFPASNIAYDLVQAAVATSVAPPSRTVVTASFKDFNPARGRVDGSLGLTPKYESTDGTAAGYNVYWGSGVGRSNRLSLLGQIAADGTRQVALTLAAGTPIPSGATHLLVFAYGANGEESWIPAAVQLNDLAPPSLPPGGISFQDLQPDGGYIGGTVQLVPSLSAVDVSTYEVFFANDTAPITTTPLCKVPPALSGDIACQLPMSTRVPQGATKLMGFTANSVGRLQTGVETLINDLTLPLIPPVVSFEDQDLRQGFIRGTVTINLSGQYAVQSRYRLYTSAGNCNSGTIIGEETVAGSPPNPSHLCQLVRQGMVITCVLPDGTPAPPENTLAAVAINGNQQTVTCGQTKPIDRWSPATAAQSLQFQDLDATVGSVGGTAKVEVRVVVPRSHTDEVVLFFATSQNRLTPPIAAGNYLDNVGGIVDILVPTATVIPADATHLRAHTRNEFGLSTGFASAVLVDFAPKVMSVGLTSTMVVSGSFGVVNSSNVESKKPQIQKAIATSIGLPTQSVSIVSIQYTSRRLQSGSSIAINSIKVVFITIVHGKAELAQTCSNFDKLSSTALSATSNSTCQQALASVTPANTTGNPTVMRQSLANDVKQALQGAVQNAAGISVDLALPVLNSTSISTLGTAPPIDPPRLPVSITISSAGRMETRWLFAGAASFITTLFLAAALLFAAAFITSLRAFREEWSACSAPDRDELEQNGDDFVVISPTDRSRRQRGAAVPSESRWEAFGRRMAGHAFRLLRRQRPPPPDPWQAMPDEVLDETLNSARVDLGGGDGARGQVQDDEFDAVPDSGIERTQVTGPIGPMLSPQQQRRPSGGDDAWVAVPDESVDNTLATSSPDRFGLPSRRPRPTPAPLVVGDQDVLPDEWDVMPDEPMEEDLATAAVGPLLNESTEDELWSTLPDEAPEPTLATEQVEVLMEEEDDFMAAADEPVSRDLPASQITDLLVPGDDEEDEDMYAPPDDEPVEDIIVHSNVEPAFLMSGPTSETTSIAPVATTGPVFGPRTTTSAGAQGPADEWAVMPDEPVEEMVASSDAGITDEVHSSRMGSGVGSIFGGRGAMRSTSGPGSMMGPGSLMRQGTETSSFTMQSDLMGPTFLREGTNSSAPSVGPQGPSLGFTGTRFGPTRFGPTSFSAGGLVGPFEPARLPQEAGTLRIAAATPDDELRIPDDMPRFPEDVLELPEDMPEFPDDNEEAWAPMPDDGTQVISPSAQQAVDFEGLDQGRGRGAPGSASSTAAAGSAASLSDTQDEAWDQIEPDEPMEGSVATARVRDAMPSRDSDWAPMDDDPIDEAPESTRNVESFQSASGGQGANVNDLDGMSLPMMPDTPPDSPPRSTNDTDTNSRGMLEL